MIWPALVRRVAGPQCWLWCTLAAVGLLTCATSATLVGSSNGAGPALVNGEGGSTPLAPTQAAGSRPPHILLNRAEHQRLAASIARRDEAATRFVHMVDTQVGGANHYGFSPSDAALVFQLTGKVHYADYAIALVDKNVTAEESLIAKGERPQVSGDSYLHIGWIIGDLAMVYDWTYDRLTPLQRQRWLAYANQAVWNVWHPQTAVWGVKPFSWSGWSVDNPGNNYYYSFLRATMLLGLAEKGDDAHAEEWLAIFRKTKFAEQLVPYFNKNLVGGGSREGTGYGTAQGTLFALMFLWEQSTGESLKTLMPHTHASLLYLIHETVPTLDRIAPIGDHARDSLAMLYDYHRSYLAVLTRLFPDEPDAGVAQYFLDHCAVPRMSQSSNLIGDFLYYLPSLKAKPLSVLFPVYYGAGTGQVFMRSSWEPSATWANFTCGPFAESHAHEDQGQLTIFKNGWLAIDENLYSHSGLRQEPEAHNLVRLERGGRTLPQRRGTSGKLLALQRRPGFVYVAGDLAPVYQDKAVVASVRQVVFLEPNAFVVLDRVDTRDPAIRAVWQLSSSTKPSDPGTMPVVIRGKQSQLSVFPLIGGPERVLTWAQIDHDLNAGYRLDMASSAESPALFLTVLSIDGMVTSAVRLATSGASLTLADGRRVTVNFAAPDATGKLEIRSARGEVQLAADLKSEVETLPTFAK